MKQTLSPIKNSEKYHFSDFTRSNFRRLLKLAKKNYRFITFDELESKDRYILMRHDVDVSVHSSLKMAQIEAEEGVSGTYFLWFHSKLYNIFEKGIFKKIKGIIKLGHKIGVHLDCEFYDLNNEADIEVHLSFERNMLENLFGVPISVFSFHSPTSEELKYTKYKYAGMFSTYSDFFKTNVFYCSDSNGYWRYDRLQDVLMEAKHDRIQVLLHPEWWTEEVMSPNQKVWRSIDKRAENNKQWYIDKLIEHNRKNIDW